MALALELARRRACNRAEMAGLSTCRSLPLQTSFPDASSITRQIGSARLSSRRRQLRAPGRGGTVIATGETVHICVDANRVGPRGCQTGYALG
jgi:hypothetical protein